MPGTLPGAREAAAETLKDHKGTALSLEEMLVRRPPSLCCEPGGFLDPGEAWRSHGRSQDDPS